MILLASAQPYIYFSVLKQWCTKKEFYTSMIEEYFCKKKTKKKNFQILPYRDIHKEHLLFVLYAVMPSICNQVLEYHPYPWNQWVVIGNLEILRSLHATQSIGPKQLPCLSGCKIKETLVEVSSLLNHFGISLVSHKRLSLSSDLFFIDI